MYISREYFSLRFFYLKQNLLLVWNFFLYSYGTQKIYFISTLCLEWLTRKHFKNIFNLIRNRKWMRETCCKSAAVVFILIHSLAQFPFKIRSNEWHQIEFQIMCAKTWKFKLCHRYWGCVAGVSQLRCMNYSNSHDILREIAHDIIWQGAMAMRHFTIFISLQLFTISS